MRQVIRLPSQSYSAGQQLNFPLSSLEPGKRVIGFLLRGRMAIVQATSAALTGRSLVSMFEQVKLGERVNATGVLLRHLRMVMGGAYGDAPAQVAAADGTYRRMVQCWIPFEDDGVSPADCCPQSSQLRDQSLIVKLAAQGWLNSGATFSGTIDLLAVVEDVNPNVVPAESEIGYHDGGQTIEILANGGQAITELFLFEESTGTAITDATVATFSLTADGRSVYNRMTAPEMNALFNYHKAKGGSIHAESESAPVQGESLTDETAAAAASSDVVTMTGEVLPLHFVPRRYNLVKHSIPTLRSVLLQFTGTDTSLRIGRRSRKAHTQGSVNRARAAIGMHPSKNVGASFQGAIAKTASKVNLSEGRQAWQIFMPVRLTG